jgi:hypothetical protein
MDKNKMADHSKNQTKTRMATSLDCFLHKRKYFYVFFIYTKILLSDHLNGFVQLTFDLRTQIFHSTTRQLQFSDVDCSFMVDWWVISGMI